MSDLPILYSFRRCPYAMRARMALWLSDRTVELREVDLKAKPSAMLLASAKGTVPVLHLAHDQVIDESQHIMVWAFQHSPAESWLGSQEQQAAAATLIGLNDGPFKGWLDRYKYPSRFPGQTATTARHEAEFFLQILEQALAQQPYLLGAKPTLADIAIFPFIRQYALVDPAWFATLPYLRLKSWLERWIASELFAAVMHKVAPWTEGQTPIIFGRVAPGQA